MDLSTFVYNILERIDDPEREGVQDTPSRVTKFYNQWLTSGDTPDFNLTTFSSENMDQMIVQKNIPFYSLCEHHMLPFFGTATVAYLPSDKILGLSKLARVVDFYSRRLNNQERLTQQVALCIERHTAARGVGVTISARHMCMEMRGIKAIGANTTTSYVTGAIRDSQSVKEEFFTLSA